MQPRLSGVLISLFIYLCKIQDVRSNFYVEHIEAIEEFMLMNDVEKVYFLCERENVRTFAAYIESNTVTQ